MENEYFFMSATGMVFIMAKGGHRWYVMGKNAGAKVPYILAYGDSKNKLSKHLKHDLGFQELK